MGSGIDRRRFLAYCSAAGLGGTLFPGVLWAQAADGNGVTAEMIAAAEQLAGLEFTPEERENLARGLNRMADGFEALRAIPLSNDVYPALRFSPILPGMTFETEQRPARMSDGPVRDVPDDLEEVAFWPVTDLARAIAARRISSVDLTEMYLARLKRYDPLLQCVVTLTEDRAREQARRADEEIAAGRYRGPLHGIPWGAKDLLATKGYPTTWGAMPYKDQVLDEDATVVQRLDEAGAVLVAKLTLGALAMGDVWFGGRTNSPWNPRRGSSGSSAGPSAAVAGGLVGFAIGSETNGSITSPSTVNAVTGLRPTFGRVSRHGAMALSWSMDKLGPMARSVEDCALILDAIHGSDGKDPTAVDFAFNWDADLDIHSLRIGHDQGSFRTGDADRGFHQRSLETLRTLGIDLIPIELPDYPMNAMNFILTVEAAAAFDELTRSNEDDLLVRQDASAWPNTFRRNRFVPAVEYIQANRLRTKLMEDMAKVMEAVDVYVAPTNTNLFMGNLTGHPLVALPSGFTEQGAPHSLSFIGNLYGEASMLAVAMAFQRATDYHLQHPDLDAAEA